MWHYWYDMKMITKLTTVICRLLKLAWRWIVREFVRLICSEMDSVTEPVKSSLNTLHATGLQDLFDQFAGSDQAVDYRELQLILNHAFAQGTYLLTCRLAWLTWWLSGQDSNRGPHSRNFLGRSFYEDLPKKILGKCAFSKLLWKDFRKNLGKYVGKHQPHHGLPPWRGGGAYAPMTRTII